MEKYQRTRGSPESFLKDTNLSVIFGAGDGRQKGSKDEAGKQCQRIVGPSGRGAPMG